MSSPEEVDDGDYDADSDITYFSEAERKINIGAGCSYAIDYQDYQGGNKLKYKEPSLNKFKNDQAELTQKSVEDSQPIQCSQKNNMLPKDREKTKKYLKKSKHFTKPYCLQSQKKLYFREPCPIKHQMQEKRKPLHSINKIKLLEQHSKKLKLHGQNLTHRVFTIRNIVSMWINGIGPKLTPVQSSSLFKEIKAIKNILSQLFHASKRLCNHLEGKPPISYKAYVAADLACEKLLIQLNPATIAKRITLQSGGEDYSDNERLHSPDTIDVNDETTDLDDEILQNVKKITIENKAKVNNLTEEGSIISKEVSLGGISPRKTLSISSSEENCRIRSSKCTEVGRTNGKKRKIRVISEYDKKETVLFSNNQQAQSTFTPEQIINEDEAGVILVKTGSIECERENMVNQSHNTSNGSQTTYFSQNTTQELQQKNSQNLLTNSMDLEKNTFRSNSRYSATDINDFNFDLHSSEDDKLIESSLPLVCSNIIEPNSKNICATKGQTLFKKQMDKSKMIQSSQDLNETRSLEINFVNKTDTINNETFLKPSPLIALPPWCAMFEMHKKKNTLPTLIELMLAGMIHPGDGVLTLKESNVKASLLKNAKIRTSEGATFQTPMAWCSAWSEGKIISRTASYNKVYYSNISLMNVCHDAFKLALEKISAAKELNGCSEKDESTFTLNCKNNEINESQGSIEIIEEEVEEIIDPILAIRSVLNHDFSEYYIDENYQNCF